MMDRQRTRRGLRDASSARNGSLRRIHLRISPYFSILLGRETSVYASAVADEGTPTSDSWRQLRLVGPTVHSGGGVPPGHEWPQRAGRTTADRR